jgi:hypothetical protein
MMRRVTLWPAYVGEDDEGQVGRAVFTRSWINR